MQKARIIISYLLVVLVLSLSVKVQGIVVSESANTVKDWSHAYFSESRGVNSLYLHPAHKSMAAPLPVMDFRANYLLRKVILLQPTPRFVATVSTAQRLSLQVSRVAYVIYPFHDFL